jgi:PHD/YefM family antitoxin component YafN of YafNO toxin-antitoxin module
MPELRSRTRRNRAQNNNQNPNPFKLTVQTRKRRTAEVNNNRKKNAIVDDKENIVRLSDTTPFRKELLDEGARVLRGEEEVADKKMDEHDSGGGRSAEKGPGADDEGSTAPLPEKVSFCFGFFFFWRDWVWMERECGKV